MSFLERVEKTTYVMFILAIVSGIALAGMGATVGAMVAVLAGLPMLEVIKTGALVGLLTGISLGMLLPLAYMFTEVNKKGK